MNGFLAKLSKLTTLPSAVLNENGGQIRPTITPRNGDFDGFWASLL
jgi:hypothetical protein